MRGLPRGLEDVVPVAWLPCFERLRELDERFQDIEVAGPPPDRHRERMEAALADLRAALLEAEEDGLPVCEVALR